MVLDNIPSKTSIIITPIISWQAVDLQKEKQSPLLFNRLPIIVLSKVSGNPMEKD